MRDWINLCESQSLLDLSVEGGSAQGYVTDNPSIITNWFTFRHEVYDQSVIDYVLEEFSVVAFLNNINVDEEYRKKGIGNSLLDQFEDHAMDMMTEAVILFADINEDQIEGFDLVKWYESKGYEEFHPAEGLLYCPLMIKDLR